MTMVGLVLLIALSNVGMLLMARNATRQREFSVRMALGAGREGVVPATIDGKPAAGSNRRRASVALCHAGNQGTWEPGRRSSRALRPTRTVLLFTLSILVLAALLFGLAPLRVALSAGPGLALKTSAATSNTDAGKSRTGKVIVTLQMALCVVLLVGGGLLVRTLRNLENIPLGFPVDGLVVFGVNPHIQSIPQGKAFYRDLISKLRALPGVESVTIMEERLGSWWSDNSDMMVDGKLPEVANGGSRTVRSNVAGPDFFKTLGVPILAGPRLCRFRYGRHPSLWASSTRSSRSASSRTRTRSDTRSEPTMASTR